MRRVRSAEIVSLLVEGSAATAASGYAAHPAALYRWGRTTATCAVEGSNHRTSSDNVTCVYSFRLCSVVYVILIFNPNHITGSAVPHAICPVRDSSREVNSQNNRVKIGTSTPREMDDHSSRSFRSDSRIHRSTRYRESHPFSALSIPDGRACLLVSEENSRPSPRRVCAQDLGSACPSRPA